jgi:hypothetical protein
MAVVVVGRRLFDLLNGWDGMQPAGEHVSVVTQIRDRRRRGR